MQDTATCSTMKPRAGIEGLDVYRVAVEFYRVLRQSTRGLRGHAVDQSYRAAKSAVLNIAEAYPMSGADRARRFRIAGGEAGESGIASLFLGPFRPPPLNHERPQVDLGRQGMRVSKKY